MSVKENEICSHIALNHPSGSCIEINKFNGLKGSSDYDSYKTGGNVQISSTAAVKIKSDDEMQIVSEESITQLCKNTIFHSGKDVKLQALATFAVETGQKGPKCSLEMAETDLELKTPHNYIHLAGPGGGTNLASALSLENFLAGGSIKIRQFPPAIILSIGGAVIEMSSDGIFSTLGGVEIRQTPAGIDFSHIPTVNGVPLLI